MAKNTVQRDKYKGRYIAIKSFDDRTIVGSGEDPQTALKQAAEKGVKDPVLIYLHDQENNQGRPVELDEKYPQV